MKRLRFVVRRLKKSKKYVCVDTKTGKRVGRARTKRERLDRRAAKLNRRAAKRAGAKSGGKSRKSRKARRGGKGNRVRDVDAPAGEIPYELTHRRTHAATGPVDGYSTGDADADMARRVAAARRELGAGNRVRDVSPTGGTEHDRRSRKSRLDKLLELLDE